MNLKPSRKTIMFKEEITTTIRKISEKNANFKRHEEDLVALKALMKVAERAYAEYLEAWQECEPVAEIEEIENLWADDEELSENCMFFGPKTISL